jgi:L-lactate dehydrogenase (cytochrome)
VDQEALGRQARLQGHPRRRGRAVRVDSGADAIVVSNHGGRQLDGAPSSIAALPAIADAVGSKIEVWMDGGIRSGQDLLKAWALGARGTLIGRAFVYGLGAMGQAGVTRALEVLQNEANLTMAFCGHTDIHGWIAAYSCQAPTERSGGRGAP